MEEQNNSIIKIDFDPSVLVEAKDKAGSIVFTADAEDAIVKLMKLEQQVSDAMKIVKAEIERQGLMVSPDFSSVSSDRLKVNYSASGSEFGYDETKRKRFPAPLFTTKVTHTPNSKAIKEYRKKNKKWPQGIFVKQRTKTIRLTLKEQ